MRLACLAVLLAVPAVASAQLRIHAAASEAPADAAGWTAETLPSGEPVWIGPVVLDVPADGVETVGLEVIGDRADVSLWLSQAVAPALFDVTAGAVGEVLAVVVDGRVVAAPAVRSAVPNGLVLVTGLRVAEAERLAAALREADRVTMGAPHGDPPGRPASASGLDRPDGPSAPAEAEQAALAFVDAVARRDWVAAADALHPESTAALRPAALGLVRLDGATAYARDGLREATFPVSGIAPAGSTDALSDRDLALLYVAALDALGDWGPMWEGRTVVGRVADVDRVHVLLRPRTGAAGTSEIAVVTVRRDAQGRWRAMLTEARGY
ncbi:SecDF P1 head subdomain-containing protein [Rubrivirga sp. IMCC45206]|uniref:SecDF P1 head subdomain-containing protein n=1 Tax=Rubrivirga sp. IMCC45206 TaxID=3391614 RepID=UPI00398F9DB4